MNYVQMIQGGGLKMISPCDNCIVKSMCTNPCDRMVKYLKDEIMAFKPKGSPVSKNNWLKEMCWNMRREPNANRQLTLSFYGIHDKENKPQMTFCLMELKECTITHLSVIKENPYG